MALSLKDIAKPAKQQKTEPAEIDIKEHSIRPWESFEELTLQTRTVTAREAVYKAKHIVRENEQMIKKHQLDIETPYQFKRAPTPRQIDLKKEPVRASGLFELLASLF